MLFGAVIANKIADFVLEIWFVRSAKGGNVKKGTTSVFDAGKNW